MAQLSNPKVSEPQAAPPARREVERSMQNHLRLIAEMTREFTASHDYKTIAHSALEKITRYIGAEAASPFLVADGGDMLACSARYGPVDITGLRISATTGVVGRAVQTRQGTMVRDVSVDADFGGGVDSKTGFKTRSLLVAPPARIASAPSRSSTASTAMACSPPTTWFCWRPWRARLRWRSTTSA